SANDLKARLWEVPTGRALGLPMEHQETVSDAVFSRDSKRVMTLTSAGTTRWWAADTGAPLSPPRPHPEPVSAVALSAVGHCLAAVVADKSVRLGSEGMDHPAAPRLDLEDGVSGLTFGSSNRFLLTANRFGTVRPWDVATGKCLGPPLP